MEKKQGIGFFEKYLTIWVALCIIIGIAVGQWLPAIPQTLSKFEYANVSTITEGRFFCYILVPANNRKTDSCQSLDLSDACSEVSCQSDNILLSFFR